jgi:hypothetical protein
MKYFLLFFTFAFFVKSDNSSDVLIAYKKFKKSYAKERNYTFKITKGIFNAETDQTLQKNTVQLYVKGDKLRQESPSELLVSDGRIQVVVYHSIKSILIKKVVKTAKKSVFDQQFSSNMDSLFSWSSTSIKDEDDLLVIYHLFYKEGPFEKIHVAFNKKTGFLQSIAYAPVEQLKKTDKKSEKMLIRIAFSDYVIKPKVSDDMFNIEAYVRLNAKNDLIPVGICSGYKIINN